MDYPELKSIDEYEVFIAETLSKWSRQQQLALAAAIAEHWLPAYERFSAAEDWGDPASLRRSLEAVWRQVLSPTSTRSELARHIEHINDVTPHMDDFDAEEALIACVVLVDAVRACVDPKNTAPYVIQLVTGVFEGMVPEWPVDPPSQARLWKKSTIRKEVQTQLKIIEQIDALQGIDADSITALKDCIRQLKPLPETRAKPKASVGLSNQTAFEQYRRYVESDLKGQVHGQLEPSEGTFLFAVTYLGFWMGRYSRRLQTINGSYGRLADEQGQRALVSRNQMLDASTEPVTWDIEVMEAIELCLASNRKLNVLDAGTIDTPHAYGPSIRQLWLQGKRQGKSDRDAWAYIRVWANHRPIAWEAEDLRKKKGRAHSVSALTEKLGRELTWKRTGDSIRPWETAADGSLWKIGINDFPDELMYRLIVDEETVGDFHDWPETWRRTDDL